MSAKNLTESKKNAVSVFVPLFKDGEKAIGIHIKLFERFGAWSFVMKSELKDCNSLIGELFDGLCRKAGLRRRIICAIDLELPEHEPNDEFLCGHFGALTCGDFFTLEAIHYLLATAFIPYWQLAARQINAFERGKSWNDTCNRAIDALGKWKAFDKAGLSDIRWEERWRKNSQGYRHNLIHGDNWRVPVKVASSARCSEHRYPKR